MHLAYEQFKENVERRTNGASAINDRPPHVTIIHENRKRRTGNTDDQAEMPLLVYVSREKRPSLPHRFKAGALNALLRVSGVLSNAAYMLVLDCDMYCNEPTSVKQAMCFHLDPKLSSSLAFVQYPQIFYNVSQKDIYDGQARSAYKTKYQGMDGIGGTVCSGTGYYLKKKALYGSPNQQDEHLLHPVEWFGQSTKFTDPLTSNENEESRRNQFTTAVLEETKKIASYGYEDNRKWGKQISYSYESLLESSFTGYLVHTRGWKSVYLYPKRPCFLGSTTIHMKDAMSQLMKWSSGLQQVGLSSDGSLATWWNEQRIYLIKCMSALLFGCLDVMMKSFGVVKANFRWKDVHDTIDVLGAIECGFHVMDNSIVQLSDPQGARTKQDQK
ncbi:hypothetical protein L1987_06838 [Smallanthus sonchifolius]|uniref:Uncharacterized protein n=1 Tax=Smallanthus sonchifolius TaxID=185202 RepID=A0ACB9JZF6_9ASTR|nr:hypothetical protein L1987_06838 [Smallanthus sonchifolius]